MGFIHPGWVGMGFQPSTVVTKTKTCAMRNPTLYDDFILIDSSASQDVPTCPKDPKDPPMEG